MLIVTFFLIGIVVVILTSSVAFMSDSPSAQSNEQRNNIPKKVSNGRYTC